MFDEIASLPEFERLCLQLTKPLRKLDTEKLAEALQDQNVPTRKQRVFENACIYHLDDAKHWELATPIPRHLARARLLEFMQDLSRDLYCAGWLSGLEDDLWEAVLRGGMDYGLGEITPVQAALLCRLAHDANGWWVWPDEYSQIRFVLLPKWLSDWQW